MVRKSIMAALATLSLSSYAMTTGAMSETLRIGVLTDMTSISSQVAGRGSVVAAEMAIEEFGRKPAGMDIELISADHQAKPELAASIAREWIDTQDIDLIVDIPNSAAALAVVELARAKKKLVMLSSSGSTRLVNENCSPYSFQWAWDTYSSAYGPAAAITQDGGKKWFFVTADYAFGHQLEIDATKIVKANGGEVIGSIRHPSGIVDFSSYLLQAQAAGADVIAFANGGLDTVNAIKQAGEFGIVQSGVKIAALLLFVPEVHSLGLDLAQGIYLSTTTYADADDSSRKWSDEFLKRTGAMPSMSQAGVYSAVLHFLKVVDKTGTRDADALAAEIRALPIDDAVTHGGSVRPDGRAVRDNYLAQVKAPQASTSEWDILEIIRKIPGEESLIPLSESVCSLVK